MKKINMEIYSKKQRKYSIKNVYGFYPIEIILSFIVILGSIYEKHYLFAIVYSLLVLTTLGYISLNSKIISEMQYKIQLAMGSVVLLFLVTYIATFFYTGLSSNANRTSDFVLLLISQVLITIISIIYLQYSIKKNDRDSFNKYKAIFHTIFYGVILLISQIPIIWIDHDSYNILVFVLSGLLAALLIITSIKILFHGMV